jgi:hypothetical protein
MSSSSSSNLPPAGGHVFSAAASAIIDAPIDHVWTLLLDFPRYADWCVHARSADSTFLLTRVHSHH